ncbi:hypothetical protein [Pontibacter pamirensis]|uniref:hypothetical protein n=1 Tax=Pontibacter pamirensis TaxID=2562824 RepID=UPI00138A263A|nr:hypothetical protein [Pontibacter pamirensis]
MKRNLILIILTLVLQSGFAQDYIVKVNGDEIPARVLEITAGDIVYHHPDSAEELASRIPKVEVFMIRFEDGTKEVFTQRLAEKDTAAVEVLTPDQLYLLGRQDALQYYKGNGTMWGSAAATALVFPYGLLGAAALGVAPTDVYQNKVSDTALLSHPEYVWGYEKQAKKKKIKKALAGAGIGSAVAVTVYGIFFASFMAMY